METIGINDRNNHYVNECSSDNSDQQSNDTCFESCDTSSNFVNSFDQSLGSSCSEVYSCNGTKKVLPQTLSDTDVSNSLTKTDHPEALPSTLDDPSATDVNGSVGTLKLQVVSQSNVTDRNASEKCPLTPLTPTSTFDILSLTDVPNSCITAGVLCCWDTILGPKVSCLWPVENVKISTDHLQFISRYTLSGDIIRSSDDKHIERKFCSITRRHLAVTSTVFCAQCKDDVALYSLSLISAEDKLETFLQWKEVFLDWLYDLTCCLRIRLLKTENEKTFSWVHSRLQSFLASLSRVIISQLPNSITVLETALHPEHSYDVQFLRRAIVAHLIQCQQSVVLGGSITQVNQVIKMLSYFTLSSRRRRCCLLSEDGKSSYFPYAHVQGVLKVPKQSDPLLPTRDLFRGHYPTALIDVTSHDVRLLCLPNEYPSRRHAHAVDDAHQTWLEDEDIKARIQFQPFGYSDTLVENLLHQLQTLPLTHGLPEAYIGHFMSFLESRALLLISYLKDETQLGQSVRELDVPRLRKALSLECLGDLLIVAGVAELFSPGVSRLILGEDESP